jgi:hypothetical protein
MSELQHLEFFLLRYAGTTRGEALNLGIVAVGPENEQEGGFADVRFMHNWRRLRCFDPLADNEEVQALEQEIRRDLQDPARRAELLKRINDSWSNLVTCVPLHGCLTESPVLEMERLSDLYLYTPKFADQGQQSGRQRILSVVQEELQDAGILELLRKEVPVGEFTKRGDPLKLDFGYPSGSDFKFLHAVALGQKGGSGMMLGVLFSQIKTTMRSRKGVTAWLTAVVDDHLDRSHNELGVALDMMQESGILIVPAAEMPRIAEEIRLELKE